MRNKSIVLSIIMEYSMKSKRMRERKRIHYPSKEDNGIV